MGLRDEIRHGGRVLRVQGYRGRRLEPLSPLPHLDKPAYDATRLLDNLPWVADLVDAMNGLGWGVYSFDHEDGIGQFEIDFNYADALTMADRYVFFRFMANSIARKHGAFATFMPKPLGDRAGSGAHFNISLADPTSGANLFAAASDSRGNKLSELGYHFLGGVLKHVEAICAVCSPMVNSYKRLIKQGSMSGFTWAPVFACYGNNNRTNSLRIPLAGGRVELRPADSACNPYLGAALTLAAGLEGIRERLDPGEPNLMNAYGLSAEERAARAACTPCPAPSAKRSRPSPPIPLAGRCSATPWPKPSSASSERSRPATTAPSPAGKPSATWSCSEPSPTPSPLHLPLSTGRQSRPVALSTLSCLLSHRFPSTTLL